MLIFIFTVFLPVLHSAETGANTSDISVEEFIKQVGKPNANTEKTIALVRMILSPTQAYVDSFKNLSLRAQAGVNMATSAVRFASYVERSEQGVDSSSMNSLNTVWAQYDLLDFTRNLGELLVGRDLKYYVGNLVVKGWKMLTGNHIDLDKRFGGLINIAESGVSSAEDSVIESRCKMVRVLAASVEGITTLGLSFTTEMPDSCAIKARICYARALARSIERVCAFDVKLLQLSMAVLAVSYLLNFSYSCMSDFYSKEAEKNAQYHEEVILRHGSNWQTDRFKRYGCRVLSEKRFKEINANMIASQSIFEWAKEKNRRIKPGLSVDIVKSHKVCIDLIKESIDSNKALIDLGCGVDKAKRSIEGAKRNIKRMEESILDSTKSS